MTEEEQKRERERGHGAAETENSLHIWRIAVHRAGSRQERHHRGHQEMLQVSVHIHKIRHLSFIVFICC